jgi:hypothetical protein
MLRPGTPVSQKEAPGALRVSRAGIRCLIGVPMQVRELEELMDQLRQPKAAHVLPGEKKDGDDPLVKSDNQIE